MLEAAFLNWQTFLIAFLLLLIILVVVIIFIPAYLERLARANFAQRNSFRRQQQEIDREERRLERLLAPYRRTRSEAFQTAVSQVDELLTQIRTDITTIGPLVDSLQCPQLFDYLLPIKHFTIAPAHINAILADANALKRIKLHFEGTHNRLAKAQEAFDHLASMPARLKSKRDVLVQRLSSLEGTISRERNAGIEALDDFARDIAELRRLFGAAELSSEQATNLPEIDAVALALQTAEATLSEAETRAAELESERVALDRRIRRATTDLDNAQATTKSGPDTGLLPQVRPIMRRAAALLNESAQDHRARREFNAAGADVTTAAQLIGFGRDLLAAHKHIQLLVERDDGVSLATPISTIQRELSELLERIESEGINSPSALADAAVAGRAARLKTRADTLVRQQDELIAELGREATRTKERLDRAWMTGQNLLTLSPDDPLVRRYNNLGAKFDEAQRRPVALDQYRREVAAFEGMWDVWVMRVQATRTRINQLRVTLPDLIDQALSLADPWACLIEDVKFIQQRAADFERLRAIFNDSRHRREAETIMDQLESVESDINDRLAQIKDRAARLSYLEADVTQILELASGGDGQPPIDDPDRPRWDRALRLIDHHIRSAHAASHYEDASIALLRAAEAANKLAL